jgi:minor extracellular serine protease Vpr
MRKSRRVAFAVALALLVAPTAAQAATPKWIVELEGAPAADGTSPTTLAAGHRRFRAEARAAGVRYQRRFSYSTLFNGVSVSATKAAAAEIGDLAAVKAVHAVQAIPLDVRTEAFSPAMSFALTMTGADIAQSRLGYTGRGVHVAVIDSGIDYDHPDLGGCFGPGCRVTNGYDLVGDDYDEEESDPQWQPVPHPDSDPDDCQAHGTHVAGILGANGAIRGVAPDVTFGAYKVFGCVGATSSDVMLAAMERVYRDGADVVNLSIGESLSGWPQAPTAQAASRLVRNGIVVVAAGGNDHLLGLHAMGGPGVGRNVVTATSVDNLVNYRLAFAITPDNRRILYWPGLGPPPAPAGTFELVRTGTPTTPDDACAPLPAGSLTGKVALVRRGGCPGITKGINVAAAGAIAVIVYNDAGPAPGAPSVPGVPIPLAFIDQADGELIDARLAEGPVGLTWGIAAVPGSTAGRLSGFASEGLAADLTLKPDVAAPGGFIRSTWPVERGSYAVVSGTSMASPHVAGVAALAISAHGKLSPGAVQALITRTADPVACPPKPFNPGGFFPATCQGGAGYNGFHGHGQVNALAAVSK